MGYRKYHDAHPMTPQLKRSDYMFNGSIVALVTPFTGQNGIDGAALDALVDFHLEQGSDGLVVAGTTGESATLGKDEFEALLAAVVRRVAGRIPVLAGTGSASTAVAVRQTRRAGELGADGALVVTPYYIRPTQAGLKAHFTAVADAAAVPVVLYNVPSRTAVDMLPETVAALAPHPRIAGIKETAGGQGRIEELRARCGPDFSVLSGDDHSCLGAMKSGADGVISVAANVAPALLHALCTAAAEHDWPAAESLDQRLQPLFDVLSLESNPIPVKWALFEMKRAGPGIRLPLTPLDPVHRQAVRHCLDALGSALRDE
jgi:4-hydroxy-tetrahydrodipicolinate synthase